MHPMGIVLAFVAFGLVSGLGVFIVTSTLSALARTLRPNVGLIPTGSLRQSLAMLFYTGLHLLGIALTAAGGYAAYRVIYG